MSEGSFNLNYHLTNEKIREICATISESRNISKIIPMNSGLSAYMVKVDFTNTSEPSWMIRVMNPENKKIFEREMGAILHATEKLNVPTPKILKIDSSRKIIPESFYVYDYLEGDTLGQQIDSLSLDEKKSLYANLGQILAKMHQDTRKEAGVLLFIDQKFKFEPFEIEHSLEEEMYQGQAEDFQWALDHEFKEQYMDLYDDCEQIWKSYGNFIRTTKNPIGFTHNDLLADNLIVNNGKISAIIDWEQGCYGDILYDLARTERGIFRRIVFLSDSERKILREVFLSSYNNVRPIESVYWNLRVAYHIVQAMDDLGQIPEYRERFPQNYCDKVENNLINEIKEYFSEYI
jgi:aminoglycoside phosphotransferase (APT) family kinase protein